MKKPDGKFYELDDAGNVTSTVVPNADVIASMNDGSKFCDFSYDIGEY